MKRQRPPHAHAFEGTTRLPRRAVLPKLLAPTLLGHSWLFPFSSCLADEARARGKSIIMLWLEGGPATIDLWDLKPGHEHGGPFQPRPTAVPGIQISEHLPRLAGEMAQIALVRSMTSPEGDHERALHLLRTGYQPAGAIQFPAFGATVAKQLAAADTELPAFVSITPTRRIKEVGNGFLSAQFAPFEVTAGERADTLQVRGLQRSAEIEPRFSRSSDALLQMLDRRFLGNSDDALASRLRTSRNQARAMIEPHISKTFALEHEPAALRDRYGRHRFGQGCLLARRLVEAGVPFVEVTLSGWDTHRKNFATVEQLAGQLDQAAATLMDDLRNRGLLDSTLIVCHGEFGRTPQINANAGRDHFPNAWSLMLAGGGLRTGQVIGATSRDGMEVSQDPIHVPDLLATVCQWAGIDPTLQQMSNVRRPIRVADLSAQPITRLL